MRQETFTLSQKELQRVAVISHCVKGDLVCARAAELLDLSPRQVQRLKARYRQGGEAAMAHASRGRPSPRRLPQPLRQRVLHLARTRYLGFNDHHLAEKLQEVEGFSLSRETLRRLLRQAGIGSPRKRRAPAHRQRRLRSSGEGELVQLDGSPHDWLEGRGPRLTALGMQDDATGKILAAQSPQAKGRIERLWGVLQDRLCSELRLAHASDLDSANRVLRSFLTDYNRRFARTPRDTATAWRLAPHDLDRICSFRHERIVSNDNVVQWEGRRLQIPPQARRFSFAGAKVQLYQTLDGRVSLYYGETRLEHTTASGG